MVDWCIIQHHNRSWLFPSNGWTSFIKQLFKEYVSTDIAYHKVNVFNTSCSHHANSRNMFSIHVDNQFVGNSYNFPQTINCCIRFCPSQLVSSRKSNNQDQMPPFLPYILLWGLQHIWLATYNLLYPAEPQSGKFQEYLTSLETLCFIRLARKP